MKLPLSSRRVGLIKCTFNSIGDFVHNGKLIKDPDFDCRLRRSTGLRPNWNSFWALEGETEPHQTRLTASLISLGATNTRRPSASLISLGATNTRRLTASPLSLGATKTSACTVTSGQGIRHVRLITGSEWIGEWDRTGMTGMGMYKMPHGVIYEGTMKSGLFEGVGVLKYPNGSFLEGLWYQGRLKYWQYDYADGLERDCPSSWPYCTMPDRRFYSEHVSGFRPANTEQLSNDHPAREIPPGHYDAGQGFYNPKTRCIVDAITGEVLSIPTVEEAKWIMERCRKAEPIDTVGYRPDLYENWFTERHASRRKPTIPSECSDKEFEYAWDRMYSLESDNSHETQRRIKHPQKDSLIGSEKSQTLDAETTYTKAEQDLLSILQQVGCKLQPMSNPSTMRRKYSLHDKIEEEQGQDPLRMASFEGLLKKIMKEIETQKQTGKTSEDSGKKLDTISNESNLFRLAQIISAYADPSRKKTASSSLGSGGALEQFRMIGKLLPSLSLTTAKTFPYSYPSPDTETMDSHKGENVSMDKKPKSEESSMVLSTNYELSENEH